MNRQTTLARSNGQDETFPHGWAVIDAEGAVLGRLAAKVAFILQGKDKPHYTNHVDVGNFVVVINAEKIRVTGTKLDDKFHERFWATPPAATSPRGARCSTGSTPSGSSRPPSAGCSPRASWATPSTASSSATPAPTTRTRLRTPAR